MRISYSMVGGSGLGLVIAKGIVEQHGGTIRVASDGKGKGTTFHVELPLFEIQPIQEETKDATLSTMASEEIVDIKRRILVVDDVLSNRKMLVRLLERSGHSCETATNGEEAVKMIRKDLNVKREGHVPFDTVCMDFEMPLLNGPEATESIRNLGYRGLVLGITGNVLQEDSDYFLNKGADEILAKPISMARLQETWVKLSSPTSKGEFVRSSLLAAS